jgi:phosphoglycolate phosphatase
MDSATHIVDSIQAACRDLKLAVPTDDQARHIIGLGLQDALTYLLPELASEDYPALVERYRYHFLAGDDRITLFDGMRQGIAGLHEDGFLLAVATGKSRKGLDRALAHSGLGAYFHASRCADEGFPKPHPEMLQVLMDMFAVSPERTLMIGDTSHDLEMARNAGVAAVAVSYGAHTLDKLLELGPAACVHSVRELMQWLKTNA